MDLNKKLEELKPYQLNCNVFDVYSYNGLSMQDLLCQFFTKINECITVSNETIDLAKWLVNEGLEIEVVKKLMIWLEDGTLENLINVNLFNTLNEKINGLSSQLEHIVHKQEFYTIFIDDYESYVGGDNDWSLAINKALNEPYDFNSKYYNKKIKVEFNPNKNYIIKAKINYNPSLVELVGNQAKIQTQGMNSSTFNVAIECNTNETFSTNYTSLKSFRTLYLSGESITDTTGILFINCSDLLTERIRVEKFGKNIRFDNNAYLLTFSHCQLGSAIDYGVYMPDGKSNYGERITFIDCNIGNSNCSIYNANSNGDMYFTNCSFDFNSSSFIENIGGKTYLNDCHIEFNNSQLSKCIASCDGNGGIIVINGGWMLGQGAEKKDIYSFTGKGTVVLENIFIHNVKHNGFADNNINIDIKNPLTYELHSCSNFKTNDKNNAVSSPNLTAIKDIIQVSTDTGTITDNLTGVNLNLSASESGLQIAKQYGGGSVASFFIAIPITSNRVYSKIRIVKNNTYGNGGTGYLTNGYCTILNGANGKYIKGRSINIGTANVSIGSSSTYDKTFITNGSMKYTSNIPNIYKGFTHYFYELQLNNYDGNNKNALLHIPELYVESF